MGDGTQWARCIAALALAGSTAVLVAAAADAAAPKVTVTLAAAPTTAETGDAVTLTAHATAFRRGYTIVIRVTEPDGSLDTVATCAAATCSGEWTEADAGAPTFQAFVRTKPHAGRIAARSSTVQVSWHTAPQPPPLATALAGHYCGLSNEGKSVCFDVVSSDVGLQSVQNLRLESNVTCGDGSGWWWWITPSSAIAIDPSALSFTYTYTGPVADSSGNATSIVADYTIAGTLDTAGNASGTVHLSHISWDQGGKHYDCAGDPRTWTARLGA